MMTPCKGTDLGPDQCCTPAHQRMANTVNCPRRKRLRRNRCRRQTRTSTGREYWTNVEVPHRLSTLLRPVPPTDSERGQASGHGPEPPSTEFHYPGSPKTPPMTPPTTESYSYPGPPTEPENEVAPEPAQSSDSELQLDRPSLSADQQPVDLGAIIYTAKGRTKQMRHISGTTRDTGNAAQRELQPAERRLNPGDSE